MITLGCDPGRKSALAMYWGDRLVYAAPVKVDTYEPKQRIRALKSAFEGARLPVTASGCLRGSPLVAFAIETQHVGQNPQSSLLLAQNAGAWLCMASLLGCATGYEVNPQDWQSMVGIARYAKCFRGRARKQIIATYYPELGERLRNNENVQSAILIALYAHLERYRRARRLMPHTLTWTRMEKEKRDRRASKKGR